MQVQPGVWGIDLGQCALKALRLELQEGQLVATAFDYVEHPKILSQPDADPDQLTREALEKFLSRNTLKGDVVAISVPGQSGLARFVKLPPVEEKKIGDIVKFEAKQQIPFNLDEVVWDYQKVSSGVVTDGFALETEIGLFAMKRDMVNRYLQHFKDVNVEVHIVQMAPLCLCNYVAYDLLNVNADAPGDAAGGRKHCVVALDIGADSSNLVVTDGARIIWQRPIPLGGNHFTRALTKDLKLTFAKAEHLKRNATKSGPELKKILTALKPVLNDFAGEVQRSLGYFTNTHRDAQVEYMVGLGSAFRLPGLQRFLAEKLQLDVRKLQKFERVGGEAVTSAPAFTENVLSFAVAYGLAMQGLRVARLHTNLLPPEIRIERLVRAKKPWATAAAAALLLGFGGLAWSYALEFRAVDKDREPLKSAVADADNVVKLAGQKKQAYDNEVAAANKEEKAVRSIIAGQDEKLDWIQLNRFVVDALPQPNGYKLPPEAVQNFWNVRSAEAAKKYQEQLTHPRPGQHIDTSDIDADLIQFNIESLDARYTDDLKAYWAAVKADRAGERFRVRPASDWDNDPKDKEAGWVVELRGYTFNKGGQRFVLEGLVEALARAGDRAGAAPAAAGTATAAPGAKPPATTPGAKSSASTPAAGPPKPAARKGQQGDPVVGHISHVVLLRADDTGALLDTGFVHALISGGTEGGGQNMSGSGSMMGLAGGGGMGGGAKGGGGGGRAEWEPLVKSGSGQVSGEKSGSGGMSPGGGSGGMAPSAPSAPSAPGPGAGSGNKPFGSGAFGGGTKPEDKPNSHLRRTDFVILFIWKEDLPSDSLRNQEVIKTEGTGQGGSPAGGMGGMGGMSGMSGGGGSGAKSPSPGGGSPPKKSDDPLDQ